MHWPRFRTARFANTGSHYSFRKHMWAHTKYDSDGRKGGNTTLKSKMAKQELVCLQDKKCAKDDWNLHVPGNDQGKRNGT